MLCTLYLTVTEIIMTSLNSKDNSDITMLMNIKNKNLYVLNGHTDFLAMLIELFCFLIGIRE